MSGGHDQQAALEQRRRQLLAGGPEANERLTTATGALLILLLAIEGVTILRLRPLLSVHLFVGMLLIPPVALKLASTGYRFLSYYGYMPAYRAKGPPAALLRGIAPIVVISTIVVLGTGVGLLVAGPSSRSSLLPLHKVSFIVWLAFTALHVLGHLPATSATLRADYGPRRTRTATAGARVARDAAIALALLAGVVLAVLFLPDFPAWLHRFGSGSPGFDD